MSFVRNRQFAGLNELRLKQKTRPVLSYIPWHLPSPLLTTFEDVYLGSVIARAKPAVRRVLTRMVPPRSALDLSASHRPKIHSADQFGPAIFDGDSLVFDKSG
jgi:hypothetical protein